MTAMADAPASVEEDRSVLATRRLCETLGFGVLKTKELKHLSTALAEAAAIEASKNPGFAERIVTIFKDMTTVTVAGKARPKAPTRPKKPQLVPINYVDPSIFSGNKPIDPYVLRHLYGNDQLRTALDLPAKELKRSVTFVEDRNPGIHPPAKATKPQLIDFIVQYVTGA